MIESHSFSFYSMSSWFKEKFSPGQDLRPFYRKRIQDRVFLDNSVLICKHSLLASDALEHAAFVKVGFYLWVILSPYNFHLVSLL